jgi:signal transduction histidine kinase
MQNERRSPLVESQQKEPKIISADKTKNEPKGPSDEKENSLDEIADLVSRVRHEINNPLTGVIGQAQLLLRSDLEPKVRHRVETIEQLAIRIRDIVAELRVVQRRRQSSEDNDAKESEKKTD